MLEPSVQGGGGVTVPRCVYKKPGHVTQGQGLVDEEVLDHRLGLVISKVFPT